VSWVFGGTSNVMYCMQRDDLRTLSANDPSSERGQLHQTDDFIVQ
jgi:hypothetical protein